MKNLKLFKTIGLLLIMLIIAGSLKAQNYSVTVKVNYLPVIVPNAPTNTPNIYDVCKGVELNLKTLYVAHVDTNNVALPDNAYTLVFSTIAGDFTTNPIVGPDYEYILTANSQTIYAKVTMTNATSCTNDTFSFVLNAKPQPTFLTSAIQTCYGVNVDLTSAIGTITNGGTAPLKEISTDSLNFNANLVANPTNYDATGLGTLNGGDYKFYARVENVDAGSECYSEIVPFILHIDTMPTLVLTPAAAANTSEACDGTTINLENFVTSVTPTNASLIFSINDPNFTTPITGAGALSYTLNRSNTTQESLTIYVKAHMNTTGCESVGAEVKSFTLLVNPMPTVTLAVNADGSQVCDATTINLSTYVTDSTAGSTLEFATDANFTNIISNHSAYVLNYGNTTTQDLPLWVRATLPSTSCTSVGAAVQSFTLKVEPAPTVKTITAGLSHGCSNNIIAYEITSPQVGVSYLWSAIGGTIQGTPPTAAKDSVLWGIASANGQVQVVYTLTTNGKACSRTATEDVNILQSPTNVNLEIVSGNAETCDDGTNNIALKVTVDGGTANYVIDYGWSPNNGTATVSTIGGSNTVTFDVTPAQKGVNYTYQLIKVTDANSCKFIIP